MQNGVTAGRQSWPLPQVPCVAALLVRHARAASVQEASGTRVDARAAQVAEGDGVGAVSSRLAAHDRIWTQPATAAAFPHWASQFLSAKKATLGGPPLSPSARPPDHP